MTGRVRLVAVLVAVSTLAGAGVVLLLSGRDVDERADAGGATQPFAGDEEPAPATDTALQASVATKPIPDGSLGPLIGDPDENRIPFCDDRNWSRVGEYVRSVGPAPEAEATGVMYVDEAAWARLSGGARTGLAKWASACRLQGGAVAVRGADSGAEMGRYDSISGLRSSDPESAP